MGPNLIRWCHSKKGRFDDTERPQGCKNTEERPRELSEKAAICLPKRESPDLPALIFSLQNSEKINLCGLNHQSHDILLWWPQQSMPTNRRYGNNEEHLMRTEAVLRACCSEGVRTIPCVQQRLSSGQRSGKALQRDKGESSGVPC